MAEVETDVDPGQPNSQKEDFNADRTGNHWRCVDQEIAKGRSKRHNLVRSQRASLDSPAQHDHCTRDDW
ncbi:hypothetical protein ACE6H2_028426 [Prunus campanulata]